MQATADHLMTDEEVDQFRDKGYAGPYTAYTPEEMERLKGPIDAVLASRGPCEAGSGQSRHLDSKLIWEMCSHPAIVERMAAIYGPDLILWRSHFFNKEHGAKAIPWHQDLNYWPLEPRINITAWLAIDAATRENSCVQFIPGSHKKAVPHVKAGEEMAFGEMADPAFVDTSKAIHMEMQPGEFVLFNEKTLHFSEPNLSQLRRLGLAVRVTIPIVKVYHEELFPKHRCILLRGEDKMGFNHMQEPPTA